MSELLPEAEARDMELATTRVGLEPVKPLPVEQPSEPKPFSPDGTGTVLDNATDEDGKLSISQQMPEAGRQAPPGPKKNAPDRGER